ncbi:NACHT and WD domain-containing protein [Colletotrichum orchidophilum]|uniref:NACHT and WD domain-containing protein n=1 Tax=Colletotrichum orchidophilum TaxID=1209926 RepID=A0A1G4BLD7_9PEZI|nr:NACHT and WD domain-containing protein [Colletotrichum orchidophilum]OHF02107.1 NACHT and WD domain-containing protein [Colletotrichum orchidophilum]
MGLGNKQSGNASELPCSVHAAPCQAPTNNMLKKLGLRKQRDRHQRDVQRGSRDTIAPLEDAESQAPAVPSTSTSFSVPASLVTGSTPRLDQDPVGLKVIHRPFGRPIADIIFVHGLGGGSQKSWSKDYNPDFFWPKNFLPLEPVIRDARLLTFGYNANFGAREGKSVMSILDFAKDLLYDMKYAKDEGGENLADLGIGEAYLQGQNDPMFEHIIEQISSIVFLSTPHRGTNLAGILNKVLQVSFGASSRPFITELVAGSSMLEKVNENFRQVARKLQIVSFYETRPTPVSELNQIMILDKDSSVLGYPGEISKPLDANHSDLCKYDSQNDPRYITVRNVLKTLVEQSNKSGISSPHANRAAWSSELEIGSASTPMLEVAPPTQSSFDNHFEELLSVSTLPRDDFSFFQDRLVFGTCSWILDTESFQNWLGDDSRKPRVLWINGNAGSGKSVLSSFLINHLTQSGLACYYFFIRFTDQKKRAINAILRSLAYQLATSNPSYAAKLRLLETAGIAYKTADYRSLWSYLFKQSLFSLSLSHPIYFVLDGLDEADSPGSIIRLFSELSHAAMPLRLLVVSRKTADIAMAFPKMSRQVQVDAISLEGSVQDFRVYIEQEMDVAGDDLYREEVTAQLLDRAGGNFLWVHLAVQKINGCHTKLDVQNALKHLPAGMEALYDRMAESVKSKPGVEGQRLGEAILDWATCTQRPLTLDELCAALRKDGLIEKSRTIIDLCGGFVTVDREGCVAMIHETARQYLTRKTTPLPPVAVDTCSADSTIFGRCMAQLSDSTVRGHFNRKRPPAFLDYAIRFWFIHLSRASVHGSTEVLTVVMKFLNSPSILTWIYLAVKNNEIRLLVTASRYLTDMVVGLRRSTTDDESLTHRQTVRLLEGWATDLVKIVGKFGSNLRQSPDAIDKLIPPFCPRDSAIYEQFGSKESHSLQISGSVGSTWDDCLTRLSFEQGASASTVLAAGSFIVVLATIHTSSHILIYDAATFEEQRRLVHPERVLSMQANSMGDLLVTYGYLTTRVWNLLRGNCLQVAENPKDRPRPHSLRFIEDDQTVLVANEDRCVRRLSIHSSTDSQWDTHSEIVEQRFKGTIHSFPNCSAISPDGTMVVFGYRAHPVAAWELDPPKMLRQCHIPADEANISRKRKTVGEVFHLRWHPYSGEVLGLTQIGLMFKWDPFEEETRLMVGTGANKMVVSRDGSLIATGDPRGTIKVFATADFSLLYQLSSQDFVNDLAFSSDSRRLYDTRGPYGNVWEPNTLIRLSDSSEVPDHNSDATGETDSLAKMSLHPEHQSARVNSVTSLSSQPHGPLYCFGTDSGLVDLCEKGRGTVCQIERLSSRMSVKHVAWSQDGRRIALTDRARRLWIKTVSPSVDNHSAWQVDLEFNVVLAPHKGRATDLLFHSAGRKLCARTPSMLLCVDIETQLWTEAELPQDMEQCTWINHPTKLDYLLAFGPRKVQVFQWSDLRKVHEQHYALPHLGGPDISAGSLAEAESPDEEHYAVGRLLSHAGSPRILLQLLCSTASNRVRHKYVLFDVNDLRIRSPKEDHPSGQEPIYDDSASFPCVILPTRIASRIREPLSLLPRQKLIFLDVERWICTWRLPHISPASTPREAANIQRYYFLPGDWATADEVHRCVVMSDGTLLCPRNGGVAAVQCADL